MPLFSEHINNMYYSGTPSYSALPSYSSYSAPTGSSYSASYLNPGGNYSKHSSLGGYTRTPLTPRWSPTTGRNYSPLLTTISERGNSSPVRIGSPRRLPRSYMPSNYTARPIVINTADIDVSKDKYRPKTTYTPVTSAPAATTTAPLPVPVPLPSMSDSVDNENSPFMPRVDGKPETGIDSSPGHQRSTIKRGRTVVRLHTIKRKEKGSPRKADVTEEIVKLDVEETKDSPDSNIGWREKLSNDLVYVDKREKKTLGAKLVEKFIVKDSNSENEDGSTKKNSPKKVDRIEMNDLKPVSNIQLKEKSKSPDRRCSMELLAEQSTLLDSLIRNENLSTVSLDLTKVGVEENSEKIGDLNVFAKKQKLSGNVLQTTQSDHSLHDRLSSFRNSKDKSFSKRKSLKKSSSGGSICRLDSITEFPKESSLNTNLPAIEESRQSIKNVITKPKLKSGPKITSTVEISPPPASPIKFRVDKVTVEEKPLPMKKEISYSSVIDEPDTLKVINEPSKSKNHRSSRRKADKFVDAISDAPSPEPDDGNFWDKIGKRETVYLMKRKELLEDERLNKRRALFWFPEDEDQETNAQNESNNGIQNPKSELGLYTGNDTEEAVVVIKKTEPNILSVDTQQKVSQGDKEAKIISTEQIISHKEIPIHKEDNICFKNKETFDKKMTEIDRIKQPKKIVDIEEDSNIVALSQNLTDINQDSNIVALNEDLTDIKHDLNIVAVSQNLTDIKQDSKTVALSQNLTDTKQDSNVVALSQKLTDIKHDSNIAALNQNLSNIKEDLNILSIACTNNVLPIIPTSEPEKPTVKKFADSSKDNDTPVIEKQKSLSEKKKSLIEKGDSSKVKEKSCKTKEKSMKKEKILKKETSKDGKEINISPTGTKLLKTVEINKSLNKKSSIKEKECKIPPTQVLKDTKYSCCTLTKDEISETASKDTCIKSDVRTNAPEGEHNICKLKDVKNSTSSNIDDDKVVKVQNDKVVKVDVTPITNKGISEESSNKISGDNEEIQKSKENSVIKKVHVPEDTDKDIPIQNVDNKIPVEDLPIENLKEILDKSSTNNDKVENVKQPSPKSESILPILAKKPIKDEPALRPLIATPRPLQKKVVQIIHSSSSSESSSEESSSEDEDEDAEESDSSDGSGEFYECENNPDGRTSTGSNDSGFDSSAPTSPAGFVHIKKGGETPGPSGAAPAQVTTPNADLLAQELEASTAYGIFRKTGRFTPPARSIPRFRKYNIEDFHFIKVLGKGSFGKVLLAELRDTEYYYAVKCLKKDVVLEDDDVECTLIERKVLALGTNHPYLCHLFATFQTDSHLFFVMEYLNGGDLMFHIQQSGRFPEARARFYAAEIVSGLKFLHKRGIVYRDLKLDNILLDYEGHVRIADFGMCKLQIFLEKTADTFCGTPDYMAPEIIKGQKYNQTVDWWSFGVLLYEMLIGQSPFSGCDEDELFWSICNEMPSYPRFLSTESLTILTRLLDKDARTRLGGMDCMHGDVRDQEFFRSIHWDRLERRDLEAPFKPRVRHPLDTQYFDKAFTGENPRLTTVEPQVLRSMDQAPFRGFSYTNPNATDR